MTPGFVHSTILKHLSHGIKEHDRYGFRIFSDIERAERGRQHQRKFIEEVLVANGFPRLFHDGDRYG